MSMRASILNNNRCGHRMSKSLLWQINQKRKSNFRDSHENRSELISFLWLKNWKQFNEWDEEATPSTRNNPILSQRFGRLQKFSYQKFAKV